MAIRNSKYLCKIFKNFFPIFTEMGTRPEGVDKEPCLISCTVHTWGLHRDKSGLYYNASGVKFETEEVNDTIIFLRKPAVDARIFK